MGLRLAHVPLPQRSWRRRTAVSPDARADATAGDATRAPSSRPLVRPSQSRETGRLPRVLRDEGSGRSLRTTSRYVVFKPDEMAASTTDTVACSRCGTSASGSYRASSAMAPAPSTPSLRSGTGHDTGTVPRDASPSPPVTAGTSRTAAPCPSAPSPVHSTQAAATSIDVLGRGSPPSRLHVLAWVGQVGHSGVRCRLVQRSNRIPLRTPPAG